MLKEIFRERKRTPSRCHASKKEMKSEIKRDTLHHVVFLVGGIEGCVFHRTLSGNTVII